jgi:hypothetical protein
MVLRKHATGIRFPPEVYGTVVNLNIMLAYFITERDILLFIRRKYLARFPFMQNMARGDTVCPIVE